MVRPEIATLAPTAIVKMREPPPPLTVSRPAPRSVDRQVLVDRDRAAW